MHKLFFFTITFLISLSSYFLISLLPYPPITLSPYNPITQPVFAQENNLGSVLGEKISENITVTAFVESNVSKDKSSLKQDKTEVLADKTNMVLITVYVRDKEGNPLANKTVTLLSNRGEVDTIEPVSNPETSWLPLVYAANSSASAKTDKQGIARFKVSSNVAGKSIFRVIVDGYIELNPIEIKFNGLPFPASLTVTVSTPWGTITLFKPTQESGEIVNTGVNINIPLALALIIFVIPILLIMIVLNNYQNLRHLRKAEKKQSHLLSMALDVFKRNNLDVDGKLQSEFKNGIKNR